MSDPTYNPWLLKGKTKAEIEELCGELKYVFCRGGASPTYICENIPDVYITFSIEKVIPFDESSDGIEVGGNRAAEDDPAYMFCSYGTFNVYPGIHNGMTREELAQTVELKDENMTLGNLYADEYHQDYYYQIIISEYECSVAIHMDDDIWKQYEELENENDIKSKILESGKDNKIDGIVIKLN